MNSPAVVTTVTSAPGYTVSVVDFIGVLTQVTTQFSLLRFFTVSLIINHTLHFHFVCIGAPHVNIDMLMRN